jgi:hypothetical protein
VRQYFIAVEELTIVAVAISTSDYGTFQHKLSRIKIKSAKTALALVTGKTILMTGWPR